MAFYLSKAISLKEYPEIKVLESLLSPVTTGTLVERWPNEDGS